MILGSLLILYFGAFTIFQNNVSEFSFIESELNGICKPLSFCQKIHTNKNNLLIMQGDYGYIIEDTFAVINLRKQPFSLQYISTLNTDTQNNSAEFVVSVIDQDLLVEKYNNNIQKLLENAFNEHNGTAMFSDRAHHEIMYGSYFSNFDDENDSGNSIGFYFLYYLSDSDYRVEKGSAVEEFFKFIWYIDGLHDIKDRNEASSWEQLPISKLYLITNNWENQKNKNLDIKAVKYIEINFID